ncbi:hypothetical protein CH373_12645 [Leptospira perolatii]|uniref:DUF3347 domain-containing protein n=1 Tax=Leptospira perolatii TaxID=2023191 RepID=A0A2M9ZLF7_9LEPT|nr:DUF3347 domain-containing protein [Leptospira perolatii]PJZ70217.1 hypothetical protein CH360_06325 [Leptospira perolatii]PJZ72898.1 hypothetical protein CH373_12645 [Leptospira perolatii]
MRKFLTIFALCNILTIQNMFAHEGKETFVLREVARIHSELYEGKTGKIDTAKLVQLLKGEADRKKDTEYFKKAIPFAEKLGSTTNEAEKRELFHKLSVELIPVVGHHDKSGVSVFYCPMAKKKWIALGKEVRNPYDPKMKQCGEVVHE